MRAEGGSTGVGVVVVGAVTWSLFLTACAASTDRRLRPVQPLPQRQAATDLLRQPAVRLTRDRQREALPRSRGEQGSPAPALQG